MVGWRRREAHPRRMCRHPLVVVGLTPGEPAWGTQVGMLGVARLLCVAAASAELTVGRTEVCGHWRGGAQWLLIGGLHAVVDSWCVELRPCAPWVLLPDHWGHDGLLARVGAQQSSAVVPLSDGQLCQLVIADGGRNVDVGAHGPVDALAQRLHVVVPWVHEGRLQLVEAPDCHIQKILHVDMAIIAGGTALVLLQQGCQHPVGVAVRQACELLNVGEHLEVVLGVHGADVYHGADGLSCLIDEPCQPLTPGGLLACR